MLTLDRRSALEWQPCSRCQERGTKCSHRIVIRTGGGYIILDCSDLSEGDKQKLFGNPSRVGSDKVGWRFYYSVTACVCVCVAVFTCDCVHV